MNSLLSPHCFFKGTGLILVIILSAIPFTNTSAMSVELAYDDSGAEGFWSDYYPNGMAVKFRPPASRWRITTILVYGFIIDRGEKPFMVEIRDEDLNVILRVSLLVSARALAPLYLKAKKHGTYTITIYFAVVEPSSLDVVFWNGGKTVTYTVEVLPEPPRLEVKVLSQALAKFKYS